MVGTAGGIALATIAAVGFSLAVRLQADALALVRGF